MTDFSALYQKHAAKVFRFALYLSGNQGDAEDITSETFVRVWTSAAHVDTSTVRGYLVCDRAQSVFAGPAASPWARTGGW
jgi:DNA-directed RNA polymerase specialized sigma24 family protein